MTDTAPQPDPTPPVAPVDPPVDPAPVDPPVSPAEPAAPADPATPESPQPPDVTTDAVPQVTDAAAPPAAGDQSATPTPDVAEPAVQVLPTGLPSDTREVAAMQKAGVATPEGKPLDSYSREILTELRVATSAVRDWLDHIERQIRKAEQASQ